MHTRGRMETPLWLSAAASLIVGILIGTLGTYLATGFVGPPVFDTMRHIFAASAGIPSLVAFGLAAYRYYTLGYRENSVRTLLKWGAYFLLLPLTAWLGYPYLHQRIGQSTGTWEWHCTARGCFWAQTQSRVPGVAPQNPVTTIPTKPGRR